MLNLGRGTVVTRRWATGRILILLSALTVIASLSAFGWVAYGAIRNMDQLAPDRWLPLLAAIGLQMVLLFWLMMVWERLLKLLWSSDVDCPKPSRLSLYSAYASSWLARYIPGRIWSVGGRAVMAGRLGVPASLVARSMVIEVAFTYFLITLIAGTLLLASSQQFLGSLGLMLVGMAVSIVGLIKLNHLGKANPINTNPSSISGKWARRIRSVMLGEARFTTSQVLSGIVVYGIYAALQLAFIVLIAAAFVPLSVGPALVMAGAWGLSLTLGWLSFVSPVGLGVRDGIAFALFTTVLDAAEAALIVTAARSAMLAVDLAFVGIVQVVQRSPNWRIIQGNRSPGYRTGELSRSGD